MWLAYLVSDSPSVSLSDLVGGDGCWKRQVFNCPNLVEEIACDNLETSFSSVWIVIFFQFCHVHYFQSLWQCLVCNLYPTSVPTCPVDTWQDGKIHNTFAIQISNQNNHTPFPHFQVLANLAKALLSNRWRSSTEMGTRRRSSRLSRCLTHPYPPTTEAVSLLLLKPNICFACVVLQPVIFGNLASSMRVVVQNMEKLGISFSDQANSVCVTLVCVLCNLGVRFVLTVSLCATWCFLSSMHGSTS